MIRNLLPTVWRRSETPLRRAEGSTFLALHREMNRMFDDFFRDFDRPSLSRPEELSHFAPPVDILENEKGVKIKVEIPGIDMKDVGVSVADGSLTVSGEKKKETESKNQDYWIQETDYGKFSRAISLPKGLDHDKVNAVYRNGIITVTIPWSEEEKRKVKKVEIKAA